MYFGLGGDDPKTFDEIGIALNLSRERVRLICDRAKLDLFKNHKVREILYHFLGTEAYSYESIGGRARKQEEKFFKWLGYVPKAEVIAAGDGNGYPGVRPF